MTIAPPQHIIDAAIRAARRSPCAKSKRGVVVYVVSSGIDIASGYNGPPAGGACAGDAVCRAACGKLCVHAEMRAIRQAHIQLHRRELGIGSMAACEAVHVKVDGPGMMLMPGGGPSCWQCSREVMDVGLAGFWLYEGEQRCSCGEGCYAPHYAKPDGDCTCPWHMGDTGQWRRYTATEFHQATLDVNSLPAWVAK